VNKTKQAVTEVINGLLKPFTSHCLSITFDNGEFAGHEAIKKALNCDTYFARPYYSWERVLKGMAITGVPEIEIEIEQAQLMINIRLRKTLNYLSPNEFITGKRVSLIVGI
jgi:IS30 family transposase